MRYIILVFVLLSFSTNATVEVLANIAPPFERQYFFNLSESAFGILSENDNNAEVWRINSETKLPELWLKFNEVKPGSNVEAVLFATDNSQAWFAGFVNGNKEIVVAHYKQDSSINYLNIDVPVEVGYFLPYEVKWSYVKEVDVLLAKLPSINGSKDLVFYCDGVTALTVSSCTFHNVSSEDFYITNQYFIETNNGEVRFYDLTDKFALNSVVQPHAPVNRIKYWPGADFVFVMLDVPGNWGIQLSGPTEPKVLAERLAPFGQNIPENNCYFYQSNKALCQSWTGLDFVNWQSEYGFALSYYHIGETWKDIPNGDLILVNSADLIVKASDENIIVFKLDLPTHELNLLPVDVELELNQYFTLDLSDLFIDLDITNISLRVQWDGDYSTTKKDIISFVSDNVVIFDTSKDIARYSPTGQLYVEIKDGIWNSEYKTSFKINNINEAPVAISPSFQLPSIKKGQQYTIKLFNYFSDPDLEQITYSSPNLPTNFKIVEAGIEVDTHTAGEFSFVVIATDPSGKSAQATMSLKIESENNNSGGSLSIIFLFFFIVVFGLKIFDKEGQPEINYSS